MKYPSFPDFKPVELSDRAVLHPRIFADRAGISEVCFTNFYIYQSQNHAAWSILNDNLIVLCYTRKHGFFYLPPLSVQGDLIQAAVIDELFTWLRDHHEVRKPRIEKASTELINPIESLQRFEIEPMRDDFDYVYLAQDLIELEGRKFHSKRNHLTRFTKTVPYQFEDINSSNIDDCIGFLGSWCNYRDGKKNPDIMSECMACYEALHHFDELNLFGGLIRVNGKLEAFSVGEQLNDQTILVHIEKANVEIPGIYAAINHFFAKRFSNGKTYINREQDMGDPGLRKAKLSYYPHHLVEKFRITSSI